jgi:dihydroflavonol-4-reductase
VRRALKGVDRVFHAAGMTSMRPDDGERMFHVNVEGARVVLEECLRAEVERVVFTSSAAALGPARRGSTADEAQLFSAAHLAIPYVTSAHEAEGQAMRMAAAGLPLVCVNPTVAFGPGDLHVTSTRLVRSFMLGRVPAYADGAINVVDVRDVAAGALLADTRGEVGQRYLLGGRNFTFDRLFADLGRLTGITPPVKVPRGLAAATAGVLGFGPGRTVLSPQEVVAASQFWTYRSTKAERELGWSARPHEETLEATVEWYWDLEGDRIARSRRSQQLQYKAAGALISAGEGTLQTGRKMVRGLGFGQR